MADTRDCEQCGSQFAPRREHARFCSARCRVAWNREHTSERAAEGSALDWSITAMRETTGRLLRLTARDRSRAFAVISEAVWWVTIVDGTLVRYHPDTYDGALDAALPAQRRLIEETLGGLRFVRNRMGHYLDPDDLVRPARGLRARRGPDHGLDLEAGSEPALESLPPRGQAWEMTRYRAYQAQLAGHTVGETFERAVAFLELAAGEAKLAPAAAASLTLLSGRPLSGRVTGRRPCLSGQAPAAVTTASVAKPSSTPSRMPQVVISLRACLRATASSSITT